jgi:hypothetical protein
MAFSAEQLTALETAAASGKLSVQLGDRRVQYQSLSDLLKAIEVAKRDVQTAAGMGGPVRRYVDFSRG